MKIVSLGWITVLGWSFAALPAGAETNDLVAVVQQDGAVAVAGQAEIPACGMNGKWTELPGRSSERYLTRHFMFLIPNQAPAMELYLAQDQTGEKPDGAFEIGLVSGYVKGFAGKAGLIAEEVRFEDCSIGTVKAKRCKVKLTRDQRSLWVYGYIFPRQPSLTFLSVRPEADAQPSLELFLASIRWK